MAFPATVAAIVPNHCPCHAGETVLELVSPPADQAQWAGPAAGPVALSPVPSGAGGQVRQAGEDRGLSGDCSAPPDPGLPWPEMFRFQVPGRVSGHGVFDEGFGIGTEGPAFGDDRTQMQPIRKCREPLTASLVPVRAFQLIKTYPEAVCGPYDPLRASAKAHDQRPGVVDVRHGLPDPSLVHIALWRFIAARVLLVAADFAPEQQIVPQQVGILKIQFRGL